MNIPTLNEVSYAKEIINLLLDNEFELAIRNNIKFGDNGCSLSGLDGWLVTYQDLLDQNNIVVSTGATKICLLTDMDNWVIKVNYGERCRDYCALEASNYQLAKESKLENFFASVYPIGNICGHNYFLQERVEIDEEMNSSNFFDYASEICESNYDPNSEDECDKYWDDVYNTCDDMDDYDRIYAMFGKTKETYVLADFVFKNDINDLHSGNWGVNKEGNLVIIDYSGFKG